MVVGCVVDGGSVGGSVVDGGLVGGDWKFSSGLVGGSVVDGGLAGGDWKFLGGSNRNLHSFTPSDLLLPLESLQAPPHHH